MKYPVWESFDNYESAVSVSHVNVLFILEAMFRFDMEDCAQVLFADTVGREEFDAILPSEVRRSD